MEIGTLHKVAQGGSAWCPVTLSDPYKKGGRCRGCVFVCSATDFTSSVWFQIQHKAVNFMMSSVFASALSIQVTHLGVWCSCSSAPLPWVSLQCCLLAITRHLVTLFFALTATCSGASKQCSVVLPKATQPHHHWCS